MVYKSVTCTYKLWEGNALVVLPKIKSNSVDLIFVDPPYNLQLNKTLQRPDHSLVQGVDESWDKFESFKAYDKFTRRYLRQCKRVLKDTGSLWIIGSYHNIFRIGTILQDMGFWILNDIIWVKANPMPNFRGKRFTNAHETLIWCTKNKNSQYTFHYHAMKMMHEGTQMRSDWYLPICSGGERIKENGLKVHPTQKPEALLYRIILSTTQRGDTILDPFMGTGTTLAMAKRLQRSAIGIDAEARYIPVVKNRLKTITPLLKQALEITGSPAPSQRLPFASLIEANIIIPGDTVQSKNGNVRAHIHADGSIETDSGVIGSIHTAGAKIQGVPSCNGWHYWHYKGQSLDYYRKNFSNLSQ